MVPGKATTGMLGRRYAKGMIGDPVGTTKSFQLTQDGLAESERLLRKRFGKAWKQACAGAVTIGAQCPAAACPDS